MGRAKIEIKRIECTRDRLATFSKRRVGLMKKAHELSVLCDVEIGLIMFTSAGTLFEFSNARMDDVIDRYRKHDVDNHGGTRLKRRIVEGPLPTRSSHTSALSNPVAEMETKQLRSELDHARRKLLQLQGESLEGLTLSDLGLLEQELENGLKRVRSTRTENLQNEVERLQKQVSHRPGVVPAQISNATLAALLPTGSSLLQSQAAALAAAGAMDVAQSAQALGLVAPTVGLAANTIAPLTSSQANLGPAAAIGNGALALLAAQSNLAGSAIQASSISGSALITAAQESGLPITSSMGAVQGAGLGGTSTTAVGLLTGSDVSSASAGGIGNLLGSSSPIQSLSNVLNFASQETRLTNTWQQAPARVAAMAKYQEKKNRRISTSAGTKKLGPGEVRVGVGLDDSDPSRTPQMDWSEIQNDPTKLLGTDEQHT
ncbi:hypothetical protein CYMTET_14547 [Cymbomonas tetramitiformis]|uniref:Uncharacterized protein n=1 Tax=Cymbomonas tetramitiformis TaxID=36881 RepID=A0AAE0GGD5_9CHLO|nr:hypothetical protein CYMTET_14547 [Cymbomonas tetramitiformis]